MLIQQGIRAFHTPGYLGRAAVMTARLHRHQEEHEREPGWLPGLA